MGEELSFYAQKRRKRKAWYYALLALLIVLFLGCAGYLVSKYFFVMKNVNIQDTSYYKKEDILNVTGLEMGKPLSTVSKKQIADAIEKEFPFLVDVKVEIGLPHDVNISFKEDPGELSLRLGSDTFVINRDLNVLTNVSKNDGIPRIELLTVDVMNCVVGEKLSFFDEGTGNIIIDVVKNLNAQNMLQDTTKIDIRDKFAIRIDYLDRFEILLGDQEDLLYKLAMIQGVVADLAPDARGEIDISDPNTAYVQLVD